MIRKELKNHRGQPRSDCGGLCRLVLHAVCPRTPGGYGWRRWGFRQPSRLKIVARRFGLSSSFPTAAPAARRANVTRQALWRKRFSRITATAARTLSVQERPGACTVSAESSARRDASGSEAKGTYRTPCPRRSIENSTPLNEGGPEPWFRRTLATFLLWKVVRRRRDKPLG